MPDLRRTVLVVDDDPTWIETLSFILEEEGYSAVTAANGLLALNALSQLPLQPFVVVTDIAMPEMDGRELLVQLHARDAELPVIVLTAEHIREGDASLAEAFRVLHKPAPVADLLTALAAAKARLALPAAL